MLAQAGSWRRRIVPSPLGRLPRPIVATIAIALVVNLAVIGAFVWSHGGQDLHVRVEARGDQFDAWIDGVHRQQRVIEGAGTSGSVVLRLGDTDSFPTLPEPRGISHVRITDLDNGDILFEDNFDRLDRQLWTVNGNTEVEDGVVAFPGGGSLRLGNEEWRDYAVDVTYRNVHSAGISVRNADADSAVVLSLLPFWFLDEGFVLGEDKTFVIDYSGPLLEPAKQESTKSTVAMALASYPHAILLAVAGLVAVFAVMLIPSWRWPWRRRLRVKLPERLRRSWPLGIALALTVVAFGTTLFIGLYYSDGLPHGPDSVAYLFQARIFASGRITAPAPPAQEAFFFFQPNFTPVINGNWASVYPFGHPLVLAIGFKAGAVWLVPPLLAAANVLLIFAIGRRMFNARVGLLAAALLGSSPFFFSAASEYLSHNTAVFYLQLSLLFMVIASRRPLLFGVLSGLFFGLLLNTRLMTTAALVVPFGVLLLAYIAPVDRRWAGSKQLAGFLVGVGVMLAAYLAYNYAFTGDALRPSYGPASGLGEYIGFGGRHSVNVGAANMQTDMAFLLLILHGWPLYIGLMFVLIPFLTGTRNLWDWFLLTCAVCTMGVWVLYEGNGIQYGPRYWYEATPFLMLLTARGIDRAAALLNDTASYLRRRAMPRVPDRSWAGGVVVYAFVAALIAFSVYSWLLGRNERYHVLASLVPESAQSFRNWNDMDDRLQNKVDDADLQNALVLVEPCFWQCYGSVFWLNDPALKGNIVYAQDYPSYRGQLFAAFPDRLVYFARYRGGVTLIPYSIERAEILGEPDGPVPQEPILASEFLPRVAARDAQRRSDLTAIRAALAEYVQRHDAYPRADEVHSLCGFPADAGCQLQEVLTPLPSDPLKRGYWYQSDGETYTVFASFEGAAEESQCPERIPAIIRQFGNFYCVRPAGD